MTKRKKPNFNVPNSTKKVRVKSRWRKPRGIDNKKRIRVKEFGASPKVGYKRRLTERGNHPLGLKELLIHNLDQLVKETEKLEGKVAIRIGGTVSKRNKEQIRTKAKELGFRTLN